jgi:DNA polymerase I-like protein with 3'-5' exonuclease and polymerase domains
MAHILPNVRKLFIPDPGYIIADCDLSGADAQVYAWDADDKDLMAAFKAGLKVHLKNARDVFPEKTRHISDEAIKAQDYPGGIYHDCKRAVHATTYGVQARSLAGKVGWTVKEAETFQRNWFGLHPAIKLWQDNTMRALHGLLPGNPPRTIINKFGFRIVYFDRVENCYTEALAWKPQSTVGINCIKSSIALRNQCPWAEILLQVHDSLVFQFPVARLSDLMQIHAAMHSVQIPYDDPLTIPWGLKMGLKSWGEATDFKWKVAAEKPNETLAEMERLRAA